MFNIDQKDLNPGFNCDLTNVKDDGKVYIRGSRKYKPPYGWKRLALDLDQKYRSEAWLWEGSDDSWAVSYHGTSKQSAEDIVKTKYDLSKGKSFGRSIAE